MNRLLRQLGVMTAIAIAGFYAFVVLRGPQGIPAVMEKRRQLHKLELENDQLRQEIERHRHHIQVLERDPEAREREIRERTNKQRPDETTIYLNDEAQQ